MFELGIHAPYILWSYGTTLFFLIALVGVSLLRQKRVRALISTTEKKAK